MAFPLVEFALFQVRIGQQEVTVHPKFKLYLRAESVEYKKDLQVFSHETKSFPLFNVVVQEFLKIVNFKMSSELFETHMLKCLINIDKEELEEKRSLLRDKVRDICKNPL